MFRSGMLSDNTVGEIALDETGEGSDRIQGWWWTSAAEGVH